MLPSYGNKQKECFVFVVDIYTLYEVHIYMHNALDILLDMIKDWEYMMEIV